MAILGAKGVGRSKHVMVSLPPKLFWFVSLYTVANGLSKSGLLHNLVDEWYDRMFTEDIEDELIAKIATRVRTSWKSYQTRHPKSTYEGYLKEVEAELKQKKLDKTSIQLVLKQLKNGTDE